MLFLHEHIPILIWTILCFKPNQAFMNHIKKKKKIMLFNKYIVKYTMDWLI